MRRPRLALVALIALVGCNSDGPYPCTEEFGIRFSPSDTTVSAGAEFNARIDLLTCGGRNRILDTFAWRSVDTAVVSVRPGLGTTSDVIVTARSPGSAQLIATGASYGAFTGPQITVLAVH